MEVNINYCYSKSVCFIYFDKMWTYSSKRCFLTTLIRNDQWTSFKSEYELVYIEINKLKVDILVQNKLVRRNVYILRIGSKNFPSFLKTSKQYKSSHPPPVIDTCNISRILL